MLCLFRDEKIICRLVIKKKNADYIRLQFFFQPGHDRITTGILVEALPVFAQALSVVNTSCRSTGVFPWAWKEANVIAIPKDNDKDNSNPKSYRPISLLPVLGKVLENLVCDCLRAHLVSYSLLSVKQFGFMPKWLAENAINALLATVRDATSK